MCEVAPRSLSAPLVVQADSIQVKVVGRFSVTRTGEKARVAVEHGIVEVTGGRARWAGLAQEKSGRPKCLRSKLHSPLHTMSETPDVAADGPMSDANQKSPPSAAAKPNGSAAWCHATYGQAAQARFEAAAALERSDPGHAPSISTEAWKAARTRGPNMRFSRTADWSWPRAAIGRGPCLSYWSAI